MLESPNTVNLNTKRLKEVDQLKLVIPAKNSNICLYRKCIAMYPKNKITWAMPHQGVSIFY